jgi:hypothetical protein
MVLERRLPQAHYPTTWDHFRRIAAQIRRRLAVLHAAGGVK